MISFINASCFSDERGAGKLQTWIQWFSPVLANEWGVYQTLNWQILKGTKNWRDLWINILDQQIGIIIRTPPLMLFRELGGWCVQFNIVWNNGLTLLG